MTTYTMIVMPAAWLAATAGLAYIRAPEWVCYIGGIVAACIALVVTQ